ncbi:MAG: hypothetical protein WA666_01390 [Nitrospirota bacterium]
MKIFLLISSLIALLTYAGISLAYGGTGAGIVPSMTINAHSLLANPSGVVFQREKFVCRQGFLTFTTSDVSPGNQMAGKNFKGELVMGSATTGKTTLSNVFLNLSGLMLNDTLYNEAKSAAISTGAVNGSYTVTQPSATTTVSFAGSYSFKAEFGEKSGIVAPMSILISNVGPQGLAPTPNFNNSTTIMTSQIAPLPEIMNISLPAIPVEISSAPPSNFAGIWSGTEVVTTNNYSSQNTIFFNLAQKGNFVWDPNQVIPCVKSGTVFGKDIIIKYYDNYIDYTFMGSLNWDGTMSGTFTTGSNNGILGKWGAVLEGSRNRGVSGIWRITCKPYNNSYSVSTNLELWQFGNTVMACGFDGTVSGSNIMFSTLGGMFYPSNLTDDIIKALGTIEMSSSPPTMSGTYEDIKNEKVVGSGTWTGTNLLLQP